MKQIATNNQILASSNGARQTHSYILTKEGTR
jgi:hypothetical protein